MMLSDLPPLQAFRDLFLYGRDADRAGELPPGLDMEPIPTESLRRRGAWTPPSIPTGWGHPLQMAAKTFDLSRPGGYIMSHVDVLPALEMPRHMSRPLVVHLSYVPGREKWEVQDNTPLTGFQMYWGRVLDRIMSKEGLNIHQPLQSMGDPRLAIADKVNRMAVGLMQLPDTGFLAFQHDMPTVLDVPPHYYPVLAEAVHRAGWVCPDMDPEYSFRAGPFVTHRECVRWMVNAIILYALEEESHAACQ